jgi:hypothetical protein
MKANREAAAAQQRLAGLVQATQDRAAAEAAAAPLVDGNGQPANPPAGDLVADLAEPKAVKRARRARADDAPKLDL